MGTVVERARTGDREAFAEIYRLFHRRVYGLCRRLLGSVEGAQDAASEVFLRVQREMNSYDAARPFPAWLLSIASHHCLDQLRRRHLERRLFEVEEREEPIHAAPGPGALDGLLLRERREAVLAAVEALPERYRVPLALRYERDLCYDEIAAELGLNRNHVATLLFRAKQELRRALAPGRKGAGV